MEILAKTTVIYRSLEDIALGNQYVQWLDYLETFTTTDIDDPTVQNGLTVTRYWTNKEDAQLYTDWVIAELAKLNVTLESSTVEDWTE